MVLDLKVSIEYGHQWRTRHNRLQTLAADYHHKHSNGSPSSVDAGSTNNTATDINKKPMDLELYKATIKGDVDNFIETLVRVSTDKELSLSSIFFDQSSPLGNSYLHVAAGLGHKNLVGFMAYHFLSLLTHRNTRGDTLLHVAARAGQDSIVRVVVRFGADSRSCNSAFDENGVRDIGNDRPDILLRFTNNEGNTALHEAVVNNHKGVARYLISMDHEVAYLVNKEGKSSLDLAVESGHKENVELMMRILTGEGRSYEDMTQGKSLVHAAIRARNKGFLEILLNKMPTLIQIRGEGEETPLHCAASIGHFEGVQYLLGKFSELVLERDGNGFLPVHIASRKGHVDIVRMLLHHCPDWRELLTTQGENILHVAAKSGKNNVVDYIIMNLEHDKLVNEKDDRGNTPLHLATMHWHPKVVSTLTWDKRTNLELVNGDGMTALDVAEECMEMMASFRKRLTWMALKSDGAPHSKCSKVPKVNTQNSLEQPQLTNMENYKDRINTLLLVSTLVATVTYSAGFTMPGGYNNSAPDPGIATMLTKTNFQIFVICDTIAMYTSIIVAVTLIWAQLGDLNLVLTSLKLALPLLGVALSMMCLAFMAGVHLVVSKLSWLAYVVLIMGIVSLSILLLLFIPLFFPNTSNHFVLRHISYYFFCLMMLASGSYRDDEEE